MPDSSPLSRVFLGVVLILAVVLIVVVACSRPSDSERNQRQSLAAGDNETPVAESPVERVPAPEAASPSVTPTDSPADVLPPERKPAPDPRADREPKLVFESDQQPGRDSESTLHEDLPAAQHQQEAIMDAQAVEERPAADSPATDAQTPQETEPASAGESGQGDADARAPQKRPTEKLQGKAGMTGTEEESEKPGTQPKPLQRLSREFARRRAAREGEHEAATEISLPPLAVYKPTVTMSQEHRQPCLVFVGDEMPDGLLVDGEGKKHSIRQSLAKPFTVVVFWDAANPYALDQFKELANDLAPFAQQGVQAIAIHVGAAPENYQELCQNYGQGALCLLDSDQTYFAKVAQKKLPRTYLLDAEGRIVWLDIEYSRTTRYELRNALQFGLQKKE